MQALRFAGLTHLHLHNLQDSRQYFEAMVALDAEDVQSRIYLSHIARMRQDLSAAENLALEAEKVAETVYQKRFHEAKLRVESKETKDAKEPTSSQDKQLEGALRQREEAQRQRKMIRDDILAIWGSAAGQAAGRVTVEALSHFLRLGGHIVKSMTQNESD